MSAAATKAAQENTALTARLAEATEIAAAAARSSAAILPSLERAYVFVEADPHSLDQVNMELVFIKTGPHPRKPQQFGVSYQLVNHGKTPAIVKAMKFLLAYQADVDGPTSRPVERVSAGAIVVPGGGIYPAPHVIPEHSHETRPEPDGIIRFKLTCSLAQSLRPEETERIGRGLFQLRFVGHVAYDDIFGNEHETRVCWRFDHETGTLVEFGGDEWNRRT